MCARSTRPPAAGRRPAPPCRPRTTSPAPPRLDAAAAAAAQVTTATFNAGGKNDKHLSEVLRDMRVDDGAKAGHDDGGGSLLDLMDSA